MYCVVDGSFTKGTSMVDAIFEENTENTTACNHARARKNKSKRYSFVMFRGHIFEGECETCVGLSRVGLSHDVKMCCEWLG